MKANIHSFESMAALDGDGIRYAVFFTGCPLRCVYCHNPDTWHKSENIWCAEELVKKILRYKPYFKNGGGVTFSGGEPLLNADFIIEAGKLLNENDINYAIDTSGSVKLTNSVKAALNNAELVILDVKFFDRESYKKYTKGEFDNFIAIGKYCSEKGIRLWLRTVIVPNINDTEEQIERYAEFSKQFIFEKYELLAFHTMGFFKYENLGINNPLKNTKALEKERLKELQSHLNNCIGNE
ncbi:MAG: pyruvate formate-lyase-activating protein [Acetobacter sp.]|nr:pyruvate formate-lyase-activating protein [Bacteroides sp.]MCM1342157.1 pyruvate formate-lyase-activating protein [Acetobacter sp.]MCM1434364.1 pyruvate formate-lyase-activating protein [Clostridiales bacterium]